MASEEDQPIFNDDDFDDEDDDDESEPINGVVPDSDSSSAEEDDSFTLAAISTAVTVAIPSSSSSISVAVPPPSSANAITIAVPDPKRPLIPEKKPIDDSRRLFQRLWTDEDEIELLQGFLEYTSSRGTNSSGHHHDTAAFYDQIKSKLQLDFNKNQLVEKLRRLKKKYRTVLSKMSSGKEFVFKSPHDQATFELSRKIWTNLSPNLHAVADIVVDDDEQTPPRLLPPNSGFGAGQINLNNVAVATPVSMVVDHKPGSGNFNSNTNNNPVGYDVMMSNFSSPAAKLSTRKRPRVSVKEEKSVRNVNLGGNVGVEMAGNANENVINNNNNMSNANAGSNVGNNVGSSGNNDLGSTMQGLIEEAVRSCLSPMVKELVNNAVNGAVFGGGGGGGGGVGGGIKGVGALALNAVPLSFSVPSVGNIGGDVMDDKWRKQQILELEVYSKRLELVQDQIKLSLEELRSMGS